jgi:hypothetical protein
MIINILISHDKRNKVISNFSLNFVTWSLFQLEHIHLTMLCDIFVSYVDFKAGFKNPLV